MMIQDESGLQVGFMACPTCECATTLKRAILPRFANLLEGALPRNIGGGIARQTATEKQNEILATKLRMEELAAEKLKDV